MMTDLERRPTAKPLRILLVADFYPPFLGGSERQTQMLARELHRRGHELCVATLWHPGQLARDDEGGVIVHRLKTLATRMPWFASDTSRRFVPPLPVPDLSWALRRLVKEFAPDIVHSFGWMTYSCAAALIGTNVPLLISARDYGYSCAVRSLLYHGRSICSGPAPTKCLGCAASTYGLPKAVSAVTGVLGCRQLLLRQATGLHSVSRYVQQILRRDLLASDSRRRRVALLERIIPSFVVPDVLEDDVTRHSVAPDLDGRLPEVPFILYVGALQPHKGLPVLLAAYQELTAPPPLVLIGTVWADTPRTFPPGVTVLHDLPHRAVMSAWTRCLFGVAPSTWPEPLGGVVFEGMSQGKAVIGTIPGGHADMIVDGETGLLVPSGNVVALTGAMQRLIDAPEECAAMGRAARTRSARFTAAAVIPQFEALYEELASARPVGR